MKTKIVNNTDVELAAKLGAEYLRSCKVAEWKELPGGRWAPMAWHVPVEAVERAKSREAPHVVEEGDDVIEKLGRAYLRTCQVAKWSEAKRPVAWVVPKDVLDLPDDAFERRSVFKGDTAAVRKLGETFLKYCSLGGGEWSVPAFVLDRLGIVPLTREQADGVRNNMSEAQHALNRSKYPEKAIAEEWLDRAVDQIPPGAKRDDAIEFLCEFLASKHDDGYCWLPRKAVAEKLGIDQEDVDSALAMLKYQKVITGIATRGRLKIFKFLGRVEPVILKFAEAS